MKLLFFYNTFFLPRAVFIERKSLKELQQYLLDPDFKGALLSSEEHIAYLNQDVFPKAFYHSAQEILFSFNLCIYMHRQSCLVEEINQIILALRSNGILKASAKQFVDRSYLKERVFSEPKVLVLQQLLGAYELLIIGLALSFSAFLLEIISSHFFFLKNFMKKL